MAANGYTPREITAIWNLVDTYLRWREFNSQGERKYISYHPSEWGKCLRLQQYKHFSELKIIDFEYPEIDSQKTRLFDKGHNMHKRWSTYFDKIGNVLMGYWRCTNPLCHLFHDDGTIIQDFDHSEDNGKQFFADLYSENKRRIYKGKNNAPILRPEKCVCGCKELEYEETSVISKELNIAGHADLILNCEKLDPKRFDGVRLTYDPSLLPMGKSKVVADMKTCSSNSWKNQIKSKGAHKEYIVQLTIYVHLLECDYGIIMYENKDNSEMFWHKVPRNNQWWEIIQWQAKKMIQWANKKILPPPKAQCKSEYMCMNCSFKSLCHKSDIWDNPNLDEMRKFFYKSLL